MTALFLYFGYTKPGNKLENILILGVGNYLMGDEGVGVHIVKELEKENIPDHVDIVDGGTGGFHLLEYLQDYNHVIMIDATMDDAETGTVKVIQPKFASDFPRSLSAHDIGLHDLVESAAVLGDLPKINLITITIDSIQNMEIELSEKVKQAIPEVIMEVRKILSLQE